jgi:hypothetical protein
LRDGAAEQALTDVGQRLCGVEIPSVVTALAQR